MSGVTLDVLYDRWDFLDLGLMMLSQTTSGSVPGPRCLICPRTTSDIQGVPDMVSEYQQSQVQDVSSQVVPGQMGLLGPGTDDALTPCWEQPWMS